MTMAASYPDSYYPSKSAQPTQTLDAANHTQLHNEAIEELIAVEHYLGKTANPEAHTVRAQLADLKTQISAAGFKSVTLTTTGTSPTASYDAVKGVLSLNIPPTATMPQNPAFSHVTSGQLSVGSLSGTMIGITGNGIADHTGAAAINVTASAITMSKPTTFVKAPLITTAGTTTNAAATLAQVDAKIAALRTELNAAILSKTILPIPKEQYQNFVTTAAANGATITSTVEANFSGTSYPATMSNTTGRDMIVHVTGCAWLKTVDISAYFQPATTSSGVTLYGLDNLGRVDAASYESIYSSFLAKVPAGKTITVYPQAWKSGAGTAYLTRFNLQIIPVGFV